MQRRVTSLLAASALALGVAGATAPAATAAAAPGEDSLASVLTSDGSKFDGNAADFDIVTEAALAIVAPSRRCCSTTWSRARP